MSSFEFLRHVHSYQNEYIRQADVKALASAGWSSALLGLLISRGYHTTILSLRFSCNLVFYSTIQGLTVSFCFLLLSSSFLFALFVALPRLNRGTKGESTPTNSLIYWLDILSLENQSYYEAIQDEQNNLSEKLAHHITVLSGILERKYFWVTLSLWAGAVGTTLGGLVVFFF